jgi:hypothetical protein
MWQPVPAEGACEERIANRSVSGGIFGSLLLCHLVKFSDVPAVREEELDCTVKFCDSTLLEILYLTYKVKLFQVSSQLLRRGFVHCKNLGRSEDRVFPL